MLLYASIVYTCLYIVSYTALRLLHFEARELSKELRSPSADRRLPLGFAWVSPLNSWSKLWLRNSTTKKLQNTTTHHLTTQHDVAQQLVPGRAEPKVWFYLKNAKTRKLLATLLACALAPDLLTHEGWPIDISWCSELLAFRAHDAFSFWMLSVYRAVLHSWFTEL